MAYAAKLCNPTPFDVKIHWHRGIYINIPAMGETDLTPAQLDDFRPGKPGSANIQELLDFHGLFVFDTDRDYDTQAYEAVQKSIKAKTQRFQEAYNSIRDRRAAEGSSPDKKTMDQLIDTFGFSKLQNEISLLEKQAKALQKVVEKKAEADETGEVFDPLTVYCINPPRKFPSEAQLNFFLNLPGNEHIKAKHEHMVASYLASKGKKISTKKNKTIVKEETSAEEMTDGLR